MNSTFQSINASATISAVRIFSYSLIMIRYVILYNIWINHIMTGDILICEVPDISEDDLSLVLGATSSIVSHICYLIILL
jgi:hypothetical protein